MKNSKIKKIEKLDNTSPMFIQSAALLLVVIKVNSLIDVINYLIEEDKK